MNRDPGKLTNSASNFNSTFPKQNTPFVLTLFLIVFSILQPRIFALDEKPSNTPNSVRLPASTATDKNIALPENQSSGSQEYVISPDDILQVYVVDVAELSRDYRVSPDGFITLPMLRAPVPAAGETLSRVAGLLTEKLKTAGLVSNPQVTVAVKESRKHSVSITGAVKRPQIYFVLGKTTLLDVLSQAEGLSDNAGSIVNVARGEIASHALNLKSEATSQQPDPRIVTINLQQLLNAENPKLNVEVYPGDRITVPPAGVVYVVGAVNKPGGFVLSASRQQLTILQAIALAEDVKSTAVQNKAMIVRKGEQYAGGTQEIPIRLKEILSGKAPDILLQANDILFIPDSSSKKAFRRGAEAVLQVVTGVAIYHR